MLEGHILGGGLVIILGIFIIVARAKRWDWFMSHYKVRNIDDAFGYMGANIFYISIGSMCIVLGLLVAIGVMK